MSTPFRHAKHIDPALMYAPPRVRGRGLVPTEPFGPEVKNSDHGSAPLESRADRAIVRARRRLHLIRNAFRNHHNPNLTVDFTGESQSRLLAFWVWRQ